MAVKGSRRGRGKSGDPGTEPPGGPTSGPETDLSPGDESVIEPAASAPAEADEFPRVRGQKEPEAPYATIEAAEAAEATGPAAPREQTSWRVSHVIVGGLALVLALAALAGLMMYGTASDRHRLGQLAQRLDGIATQAEEQADRLAAAENAAAGLRSELTQVTTALAELQSAAEGNRQALDRLMQGFDELRNSAALPADGAGTGEAVGELRDSVRAIDGRVASLEQGSHLEDLIGRIARLEEEIAGLRERAAERAQTTGALGEAYAALAERVATGAPFAGELEAVTAELPGAPGLEVLRPLAGGGVATLSDLKARLAEIAGQAPPAQVEEPTSADPDGVWQTMRQRLQAMVTVRRADETDWAAVLTRAGEALEKGDLDAAIGEVEAAGDGMPGGLAEWLADARASRDAQAALAELSDAVLRQLAGRR